MKRINEFNTMVVTNFQYQLLCGVLGRVDDETDGQHIGGS